MREILFRGKRLANGKWVYGGFHSRFQRSFIIGMSQSMRIDGTELIPETVGQYTGLTDKNGTKIFEGDIVKHPIGTFIVKFLNGTFLSSLTETNYLSFLCAIHNRSEVIGNIHDNPELLKGGDDNAQ